MKLMILTVVAFFAANAFAGFQGFQSTTSLGTFNKIKCSTGMTCTKVGDKLNMVTTSAGTLESVISPTTGTTLTGSQCGSLILNSPSAISVNLPTGTSDLVGCRFKFLLAYASGITINPNIVSNQIYGLTNATGDMIYNATAGSYVELVYGGPVVSTSGAWFAMPGVVSGSGGAYWSDAN